MKKYLLTVLAALMLAACGSTPSMKDMTVRMGDTDNSIQVTDMRSIERNGVLTAQVTIQNDSRSNLVSYRFKWLGKNGVSVTDEEAWKPVTVGKGQSTVIMGIAPTPDATDFRFELNQYK
ncbi:YcfL family protein [Polynucleobacter necessarius]|uniref:YcfL family protein n=1 Tax=Polynucleobacter necessarius TaxID=576610 RepID=UPI000FE1A3BE|nr:YcfL family protein [Polynucleobacter necessarius]